jgi:hypothetical protein
MNSLSLLSTPCEDDSTFNWSKWKGSIKVYVSDQEVKKNLDDSSETSYLLCITSRKLLEELTKLPVMFVLSSDFFDRNALVFVADPLKTLMTLASSRRTVESPHELI